MLRSHLWPNTTPRYLYLTNPIEGSDVYLPGTASLAHLGRIGLRLLDSIHDCWTEEMKIAHLQMLEVWAIDDVLHKTREFGKFQAPQECDSEI